MFFGAVFFIAGTLKLMDPVGSSLVVSEYFKFLHAGFLGTAVSWWTALFLSLAETVLGAAVITGVWRRQVAYIAAAFCISFTGITLALLIKNPNMDCGCFGEAVHLTHAQSFIKNLVLDLLWILIYVPFSRIKNARPGKYVGFKISLLGIALFALGFANSIPAVDYTDMRPGSELFRPDDLLTEEAPMLSFCSPNDGYADSLAVNGHVMIFSVYLPDRLSDFEWSRVEAGVANALAAGYTPLVLTTYIPEEMPESIMEHTYLADMRVLMTLNRTNGGATYISDGLVVKKWSARKIPDEDELTDLKSKDVTEVMMKASSKPLSALQGYVILMFALMLML